MHRFIIIASKPILNRAIRKHLVGRYSALQTKNLVASGWRSYRSLRKAAPRETTFGARIMVELAVVSEAFYLELLRIENDHDKAIELFNKVAWDIYEMMGKTAWSITGIWSNGSHDHLRKAIMAFRKFPFGSPSYKWKDLPGQQNEVRFNCERCPVATYFKGKGLAEVGYSTWCQYDYRMAELWGGKLELTNTIAGGAEVCDFKWTSKQETIS